MMESDFLRETFNRERAVCINFLVARFMGLARRVDQCLSRIEFGHDAVDGIALHGYSFTSASGQSVRISKIEIAGRKRTNRNMAARNIPMVPM
jgi:hypothetical protein